MKRKEKNLTQEQLADNLWVSNKTISKWENGKCMPDYSVVMSLCQELDITISEFMDAKVKQRDCYVSAIKILGWNKFPRFYFWSDIRDIYWGNANRHLCCKPYIQRPIVSK